MRKLYFILCLTLFSNFQLFSNPLPGPVDLKISEFMFNSDNTWVLELVDEFIDRNYHFCDSLLICSSTGKARVKDISKNDLCYPPYYLITQDDLLSPLTINKDGDSITIVHFYKGSDIHMPITTLTFGNYPNAMISKPTEGKSIVSVLTDCLDGDEYSNNYYSKNNNPSIGDCNKHESSIYGTLRGKIYDENGQSLCNRAFMFSFGDKVRGEYESSTDNEGNYNLKVFSNTLILDSIYLKKIEFNPNYNLLGAINFVQMDIEPGDEIDLDIYLTGDYIYVSLSPEVNVSNNPIKIYPNPVKEGSMLNYEISLPVFTANVELEVLSLAGQKLLRKKITDNIGVIDLKDEIPGIYIVNCIVNEKKIYSTRIIIAK